MDEYIDRKQELNLVESSGMWGWSKEQLYDEMQDVPSADVAPVVHGTWFLRHIGHGHYWECSVCHATPIYVTNNTNYCPNCGAKMDVEQEE